jgi:choline dehydrogenase-like flavoprotein
VGAPRQRDSQHVDALGLPRPVVHYSLDEYVLAGLAAAAGVSQLLFERVGIQDRTDSAKSFSAKASWKGVTYAWDGAGHFAGTHILGTDPSNSVVDDRQRSWDFDNLLVPGPGSMPTMGTSNRTLTVAALAHRTARDVIENLNGRRAG